MNPLSKNKAKEILNSDINTFLSIVNDYNKEFPNRDITYSKNVFLPLTHVCQNACGYCTFKEDASETKTLIMNKKEVFKTISDAKRYDCKEALFTFGENADENIHVKRKLDEYGYDSMVDYVYSLSTKILNDYDMLPHTNMGIINKDDLKYLSQVNASMGLMLETTNRNLLKTIVHKDSPTKDPTKRINFIKEAGRQKIPFTTGLLIGIGESSDDHIDSLFEIRKMQDKYGHIQEIILQNFKTKENIPMHDYPEPSVMELIKLTILAKLMFPDVSIQIPPNLNSNLMQFFIICGADDFGGISPVTEDFINPEDKWPKIEELSNSVNELGFNLKERLCIYEKYINHEFLDNENLYEKTRQLIKKIQ